MRTGCWGEYLDVKWKDRHSSYYNLYTCGPEPAHNNGYGLLPPPPIKSWAPLGWEFNTYKTKTGGRVKIWYESIKKKRLLGSPWLRRGNNIKKDIIKTRCGILNWIYVAQDRNQWWHLLNNGPSISINCGKFLD